MATTLRDVAAEAGVAINTTRKVLSDDPTVRPYIRQRVLAAARKLRYRPNLLARALRTRELNLVPITVPHVPTQYFAVLAHALADELLTAGYEPALCFDASRLVAMNHALATCASILAYSVNEPLVRAVAKRQAVVSINDLLPPIPGVVRVRFDFETPYRTLTDAVLRQPRKRVAVCSDYYARCVAAGRWVQKFDVVERRLAEAGLRTVAPDGKPCFTGPEEFADFVCAHRGAVDTVFCEDDTVAARVFGLLAHGGMRIPDDVLVIGCDADLVMPGAWSVRIDRREIARHAVELLKLLLATPRASEERVVVPVPVDDRGEAV